MNALCPNCQTSYEIDLAKLPAPKIRLKCTRCEFIFPFEQEIPEESTAPPASDFPSLEERTPPLTAEEKEPMGAVINVDEVSEEVSINRFDVDDRTEREKLPVTMGKWVLITGISAVLAISLLTYMHSLEKKWNSPKTPTVAKAEVPPESTPVVTETPDTNSKELLDRLQEAHVAKPPEKKEVASPPVARLTSPAPVKEVNLAPYQKLYQDWTPTSFGKLREMLAAELKSGTPSDQLILMAANVYSYLGMRSEQKSWLSYGYQAAYRFKSRHETDLLGSRALAFAYAASGQVGKALSIAKEVVVLRPDDPVALYVYALAMRGDKGDKEGLRYLEDIYSRFPKSFPISEALASGYLAREQYAKARETALPLIRRELNDPKLEEILAMAYEGEGKWTETAALLEDLSKQTDRWSIRLSLARAQRKLGKVDEARRALDSVLQTSATSKMSMADRALVTLERGKVDFDQNKFGESIVYFKESYRLNPSDLSASQYLAGALYREKRYVEAAAAYERVAKAKPDDSSVKRYLGMSKLEAGDYDGAEKALREVIRMGEEDPSLDYHLARIREAKGDKSGAIAFLERALQKDPNYTNAQIRLQKLTAK